MRTGNRNVPPAQLTSTSAPSGRSVDIQGDMRLRHELGNSWRRETQFIRAENVVHGQQQPLVLTRLKCGREWR